MWGRKGRREKDDVRGEERREFVEEVGNGGGIEEGEFGEEWKEEKEEGERDRRRGS